jgi:hypothetical protein
MTYYLIDFENVHASGIADPAVCVEGDIVCIYYGADSQDLPLETIHAFYQKHVGLQTVPVNTGSKNALDFQLTTHLGYLIGSREHSGAAYRIVSNDTGYDCVVTYWKDHGIDIARIADLTGVEKNTAKKKAVRSKAKPSPEPKKSAEAKSKPSAEQKQITEPEQSTENKPSTEPKQSTENKPSTEPKPSTETKPSAEQKPNTEQKKNSAHRKKRTGNSARGIIRTTKTEMLQYLEPDEYEDELLDIINGYKTRTSINNYLGKHFRDSQKASVIYKKLKPLMAEKGKS